MPRRPVILTTKRLGVIDISQMLIGEQVVLSDVVRIKRDADLYRGNIRDLQLRHIVLEHAK